LLLFISNDMWSHCELRKIDVGRNESKEKKKQIEKRII